MRQSKLFKPEMEWAYLGAVVCNWSSSLSSLVGRSRNCRGSRVVSRVSPTTKTNIEFSSPGIETTRNLSFHWCIKYSKYQYPHCAICGQMALNSPNMILCLARWKPYKMRIWPRVIKRPPVLQKCQHSNRKLWTRKDVLLWTPFAHTLIILHGVGLFGLWQPLASHFSSLRCPIGLTDWPLLALSSISLGSCNSVLSWYSSSFDSCVDQVLSHDHCKIHQKHCSSRHFCWARQL